MPRIDSDSSVVYLALSILCSDQNSLVPELLYLLSPRQVIDFIKVYGGETIRVPTSEEFSKDLMVALCCYHVIVEGNSWDWIALTYHADGNTIRSLKIKTEHWWNKLSPSEQDFILSLDCHEKARKQEEEICK